MSNDEIFNDEQIEESLDDLEKIDNWANGASFGLLTGLQKQLYHN